MSTLISTLVPLKAHDQFVISHGKSGALGVFSTPGPLTLRRGQAVLVQTARGIEVGSVLCPATLRQARILGATSSGSLLRCLTPDDQAKREERREIEQRIFQTSRTWAERDDLSLEILDVDLLLDGTQAVIQFVGNDADTEKLAQSLESAFRIAIRLENLASPIVTDEPDHEHGGCDKPDCGRAAGGEGGCSTCSTGGGCSSCGSSQTDISPYFSHLRTKMEASQRIPLA